MGIFDKFKKTTIKQSNSISILNTDYPIEKNNWFSVFSACLGQSISIQEACAERVVQGQNWNVDFGVGEISFGTKVYPVQFIGSEANISNSWKWGWDNVNGFDDKLLQLANEVKCIGDLWSLDPLRIANFELTDMLNGHTLSIVACAISKSKHFYYRGPHDGGAVLMAISGVPDSVFAPVDLQKFISITTQCIRQFHVDHKIFIESYLLWNGTNYEWDNETIVAHFNKDLYIQFEKSEEFLRICSMKTNCTK